MGLPGSGKTSLARSLAEEHGLKDVEVDAFYWGERWQRVEYETFAKNVRDYLADSPDMWVVDNYSSKIAKMGMLEEVDTVILLDLPLLLCMHRVAKRSFKRLASRKKLWDGPVETPWSAIKLLYVMPK